MPRRLRSGIRRRRRDSNPWYPCEYGGFQNRSLRPLGHSSEGLFCSAFSSRMRPPSRSPRATDPIARLGGPGGRCGRGSPSAGALRRRRRGGELEDRPRRPRLAVVAREHAVRRRAAAPRGVARRTRHRRRARRVRRREPPREPRRRAWQVLRAKVECGRTSSQSPPVTDHFQPVARAGSAPWIQAAPSITNGTSGFAAAASEAGSRALRVLSASTDGRARLVGLARRHEPTWADRARRVSRIATAPLVELTIAIVVEAIAESAVREAEIRVMRPSHSSAVGGAHRRG